MAQWMTTGGNGDGLAVEANTAHRIVLAKPLKNAEGQVLAHWPFKLQGPSGEEITPDGLDAKGATTTNKVDAGHFVSDEKGGYQFQGLPTGCRVTALPSQGGHFVAKEGNRVFSWLKDAAMKVGDEAMVVGGEAVGYAELAGFRYPVKAYQFKVSKILTRGSRLDEAGLQDLASRGFHGVTNLCAEYDDSDKVRAAGLNPLHLHIIDNTAPSLDQMKQFLDFVEGAGNQPSYVHCEAGIGRTGTSVACYRMGIEGWSVDDAIAEAKKFGDHLENQLSFLREFSDALHAGKIAGYPKK